MCLKYQDIFEYECLHLVTSLETPSNGMTHREGPQLVVYLLDNQKALLRHFEQSFLPVLSDRGRHQFEQQVRLSSSIHWLE